MKARQSRAPCVGQWGHHQGPRLWGKDIPVSEVPAVEKGGGLEEVAWVVEEEGSFKECLGEIGAGPGQGRVLRDDEFPHDALWGRERETKGGWAHRGVRRAEPGVTSGACRRSSRPPTWPSSCQSWGCRERTLPVTAHRSAHSLSHGACHIDGVEDPQQVGRA